MNHLIRQRIHAFRNALVLAADTRSHECFGMGRWKELNAFPRGCCELASHFLAQYLQDSDPSLQPVIIHMQTTTDFRENEKSTIQSHVIVKLDDWYIDLTLNQFDEYPNYISAEPVETGGVLGTLLREIPQYEGEIETRRVNLDRLKGIYGWLRDSADAILETDPEWQAWEQSIAEHREAVLKLFPFLAESPRTRTNVPGDGK